MKYLPLTKSAELTKNYRCGGWITLIIGLLIFSLVSSLVIQIGSFFSDSFGILIQLYFYSLVILAIILYSKFVEKRDIQSLGISSKNFTKNYSFGAILGFVMIGATIIGNLIMQSISISINNNVNILYLMLLLFGFCIQGFAEELLIKGYIMNTIASMSNMTIGIVINSVIFSLNHAINPNVTSIGLINIFLLGFLLSLIFFYSDNLYLVGALHSSWNFFIAILGLPVSGKIVNETIFRIKTTDSLSILNGGNFGLEGGLLATIILIVGVGTCLSFIKIKLEVAL